MLIVRYKVRMFSKIMKMRQMKRSQIWRRLGERGCTCVIFMAYGERGGSVIERVKRALRM